MHKVKEGKRLIAVLQHFNYYAWKKLSPTKVIKTTHKNS